jgi:hypothetical protein
MHFRSATRSRPKVAIALGRKLAQTEVLEMNLHHLWFVINWIVKRNVRHSSTSVGPLQFDRESTNMMIFRLCKLSSCLSPDSLRRLVQKETESYQSNLSAVIRRSSIKRRRISGKEERCLDVLGQSYARVGTRVEGVPVVQSNRVPVVR